MFRSYCFSAVIVLAGLAAPAYGQIKLEWKFKEGDKIYREASSQQKNSNKVSFFGMDTTNNQTFKQTATEVISVVKKTPDTLVIDHTLQSIKMDFGGLPGPAANLPQQLEGTTLRATLNAKNQVTHLDGLQAVIKKLSGDDPVARKTFEAVLNEQMMVKQIEELFSFLPDKPVNSGDKWERKISMPLGPMGTFDAAHTFTYAGKETVNGKSLDKITATATMTYVPPKGNEGILPFQISKGDLKAETFKATYYFDAEAGRLVQSEVKMRVKGTLTIVVSGQNAEMTMDQDTTFTARISDKNPAGK